MIINLFVLFADYSFLSLSFFMNSMEIINSISDIDENMQTSYKDLGIEYVFRVNFTDGMNVPFSEIKKYLRIYV